VLKLTLSHDCFCLPVDQVLTQHSLALQLLGKADKDSDYTIVIAFVRWRLLCVKLTLVTKLLVL